MNEETIIEKRPTANGQQETKKEGSAWKQVTLGGVSGILMGAAKTADNATAEAQQAEGATEAALPVAQMHNDMSFGEAFEAARAEVGPGGVFIWHGGIYNTYTADEWNNMTSQQKSDFAHQVNPEVHAHEVPTPTDAHPDVAVHQAVEATPEQPSQDVEVQVVSQETSETPDADAEVHIIGYGEVQGHVAVRLDTDGDGQADVAIIDVDDSGGLSDPDVLVDDQGNMATYGELNNEPDPNLLASMENPDVAPDMPDYMNDANVDDMNVIA